MNILNGTITEIESHEGVSLVKVKTADDNIFTSIVLDTASSEAYLKEGNSVQVIFKETEVIISKDVHLNISIQNKMYCTVQSVKIGVLLSQINLLLGQTPIKSIITTNACKQLQLNDNDKVIALVKTTEVSLSAND